MLQPIRAYRFEWLGWRRQATEPAPDLLLLALHLAFVRLSVSLEAEGRPPALAFVISPTSAPPIAMLARHLRTGSFPRKRSRSRSRPHEGRFRMSLQRWNTIQHGCAVEQPGSSSGEATG